MNNEQPSSPLHYHYGDEAPDDEEAVAHGIGNGVAHGREGAAERILHGAERGCTRTGACAAAEGDGGVELEYLMAEPQPEEQGYHGADGPCHEEHRPYRPYARHERGGGLDAYDGDKHVEAEVIHDP